MKNNKLKISYEPDADVLTWELSNKPIDYAEMTGNFIVHFTKKNQPVLIEFLEASKFFRQAENLIDKEKVRA